VIKGDVNSDGTFDTGDVVLMSRRAGGWVGPGTPFDEDAADLGAGDYVQGLLLMFRALKGEDVDGDGLATREENAIGTSCFSNDTDGDGWLDSEDPHPLELDPPGPPRDVRVIDGPSGIALTWLSPPGQTGSYLIHRYGSDGEYTFFTVDGSAVSFVDTTAQPGVVYFYWIQPLHPNGLEGAMVNCDVTDPANQQLWLTGALGTLPNPHFTASAAPGEVTLTWEASTDPSVIGYRIYRSAVAVPLGSTAGLQLEQTASGAGTTSAVVSNLSAGKHYFRITAFSGTAESLLASAKQVVVDVP
jgi:hypothetical protein